MNTSSRLGRLTASLALATVTIAPLAHADGAFTTKKSRAGVEVATRPTAGSSLDEFRAQTDVKTSLASLVALVDDAAHFPAWIADCDEARIVAGATTPQDHTAYFVSHAPFPFENRDIVVHVTESQDPGTKAVTIRMKGTPNAFPAQAGRVRVPIFEGSWTFSPLADGVVHVVYQVKSEPGGSIPGWLASATVTDGPLKTLANLREAVKAPAYKNAHVAWVTEP
jgi:hypothetical protein